MRTLLEICVDDAAGVDTAVAGGANRIELCSALELGGLTPSPALLHYAVTTGLPVHPMIRPRAGDYVLQDGDVAFMIAEIAFALNAGAAGIVIGAQMPDGTLDRDALAVFRDVVRDAKIVLHRAIDLTPDPVAATETACTLGYDHILSSGGAPTAPEGVATLARMVKQANGRLSVMAGSGVGPANVAQLIADTGVREVHGSASRFGPAPDAAIVRLGFAFGPRRITDLETVRSLRAAIDHHSASRFGEN